MPSKRILHVTHFTPQIHGESMMACQLRDCALTWDDIDYSFINTAYSKSREELSISGIGKLAKLVLYLIKYVTTLVFKRPALVILQPAFLPAPFIKDSLFIWCACLLRIKVIAWVHMDPSRLKLEDRSLSYQKWAQATLTRVSAFVGCAPSLPDQWPDWMKERPNHTVSNAIPDPVSPLTRNPKDKQGDEIRFLYLSAMDEEKGWRELLAAAITTCNNHPKAIFEFRGSPSGTESTESVRRAFESTGHENRIQWLGPAWDDEKKACFERADVFILPSWTEQCPLVVLEAMAYSLPLIATNVGAIQDMVDGRHGGRLIPPMKVGDLERAITELISLGPQSLEPMGEHNRSTYEDHFSMPAFDHAWRILIRKL